MVFFLLLFTTTLHLPMDKTEVALTVHGTLAYGSHT